MGAETTKVLLYLLVQNILSQPKEGIARFNHLEDTNSHLSEWVENYSFIENLMKSLSQACPHILQKDRDEHQTYKPTYYTFYSCDLNPHTCH